MTGRVFVWQWFWFAHPHRRLPPYTTSAFCVQSPKRSGRFRRAQAQGLTRGGDRSATAKTYGGGVHMRRLVPPPEGDHQACTFACALQRRCHSSGRFLTESRRSPRHDHRAGTRTRTEAFSKRGISIHELVDILSTSSYIQCFSESSLPAPQHFSATLSLSGKCGSGMAAPGARHSKQRSTVVSTLSSLPQILDGCGRDECAGIADRCTGSISDGTTLPRHSF